MLKKVFAFCGSTRSASTNLNIIKAITTLFKDVCEIRLFDGLAQLPHFNPDLDTNDAPASVVAFRSFIKEADAVLICTPEYAFGVPGTLKNALDWTVSSCEFSNKRVALITAATSGVKAHQALLDTLNVIESKTDNTTLLIPFAKTKVNDKAEITDSKTLQEVKDLMAALLDYNKS